MCESVWADISQNFEKKNTNIVTYFIQTKFVKDKSNDSIKSNIISNINDIINEYLGKMTKNEWDIINKITDELINNIEERIKLFLILDIHKNNRKLKDSIASKYKVNPDEIKISLDDIFEGNNLKNKCFGILSELSKKLYEDINNSLMVSIKAKIKKIKESKFDKVLPENLINRNLLLPDDEKKEINKAETDDEDEPEE